QYETDFHHYFSPSPRAKTGTKSITYVQPKTRVETTFHTENPATATKNSKTINNNRPIAPVLAPKNTP
ncbi:MAG: hypothetical protein PUK40_06335, partial [Actinomycetaceae bacterium]|nr:hypothetical protein [Actinomycetaceae bacterium]